MAVVGRLLPISAEGAGPRDSGLAEFVDSYARFASADWGGSVAVAAVKDGSFSPRTREASAFSEMSC
jgi:hypothetical protein